MTEMLKVEGLGVRYGVIPAVDEVGFTLSQGELMVLLGANGAGKSSTLNAIAGLVASHTGSILHEGRDVTGWRTDKLAKHGMALVPEGRMVVGCLSVKENLQLSAYARGRSRTASMEAVFDLFPRLHERQSQIASSLSGGEQQMLAVGRALMTKPSVLLLDEPSMGLAPSIVGVVMEAIKNIHASGVSIVLVEQNAALALPLADRAMLLDRGRIVSSGSGEEMSKQPDLIAELLGLSEGGDGEVKDS